MPKKKKKKAKFCIPATVKQAGFVLMAVIGVVGGVWALDEHWVTVDRHETSQKEVYAMYGQTNRSIYIRDLQAAVRFWGREVAIWSRELRQFPGDPIVLEYLNNAKAQLRGASEELKRVTAPPPPSPPPGYGYPQQQQQYQYPPQGGYR